jgi:NAD(P)-dependent dehydrogenase (short-subunit alcohol dehydrogenase family)
MRILVTGAGRAIGRATVLELVARGHEVVATARDPELLADLAGATALRLDVTDPDSVAACIGDAGDLDGLVNNAALWGAGPMEGFPVDQLQRMFETNTIGALRTVQAVLPAWRRRGSGVIVNVSSVQGRVATPLEGAYAATKFALEAISEALHYELRHFGIRTVVVEPGYVAPGMKRLDEHRGDPAYAPLWEQMTGNDEKLNPDGRPGPELVARAVGDAVERPDTPLRVPVGADAELALATRARLGDVEFEMTMREVLGITW